MENGNKVFEYAVIRVVPRVEREEFINVGVILFCKSTGYLGIKIEVPIVKIQTFLLDEDMEDVNQHLVAFESIAKGEALDNAIAQLEAAERFRWLTATRSTMVQSSKVHTGLCQNESRTLSHLFQQMVG